MEVTCPACAARYTCNEEKLRGKTARMRCKACDTVWLVSGINDGNDSPNEPRAARTVKRGAEREHRDLFASRPLDMGSVKQTLRPAPLPAGFPDESQQLAARNEASVLFTVDALRDQNARLHSGNAPPPGADLAPLSGLPIEDDSGVIDLNQLASIPPRVGQRSAVAPLFSEPPPAAFAADVDGPSPSSMVAMPGGFRLSKRAIAGMAAAGVALVLCCVGISAAFKGEDPVARAAANSMSAIPAPTTTAAPAASPAATTTDPAPASTTATTASTSDDDDKSAKPGKKKKKTFSGGGAKASFASSSSPKMSTTVAASPKAPKAADKCGCKGDFNCIIRCTATGK